MKKHDPRNDAQPMTGDSPSTIFDPVHNNYEGPFQAIEFPEEFKVLDQSYPTEPKVMATFRKDLPQLRGLTRPTAEELSMNLASLLNGPETLRKN